MRGAGRKILVALAAIALSFAALLALMVFSQADLMFPVHAVARAGPMPSDGEAWTVNVADGAVLHGVHVKPARSGKQRVLVLGFGGNAWNGQDVAIYLHAVFPDAEVVAFHYRGYRPSTGQPSADALVADAPIVFDEAVRRIKPDRTVVVGFSIGTGVAAALSRRREIDGVILVTPFDSLKAVAQDMYPWLPIAPFFQHEMPAADDLQGSTVPVAILAAEHDEIIASRRTDALRRKVPNLIFDRTIEGAGHNDIYQRNDFQEAMRDSLRLIISAKK